MTAKKVVIMRGISGSGKSTYIKKHYPDALVCSADHFFEKDDGSYQFNAKQLGIAHGICMKKFKKALAHGTDLVVVDNTNTKAREFRPYLMAAQHAGYEIEIVRLETPVDVAAARNAHGVPEEAVQRMSDRMAPAPSGYHEKVVSGTDNN